MEVIQFNAEAHPLEHRVAAWERALRTVDIHTSGFADTPIPQGSLAGLESRQGSRLLRLTSSPQTLAWQNPARATDVWLAVLFEGAAHLGTGQPFGTNDILLGTMATRSELTLTEPFRLLFVHLRAETLDPRLRRMSLDCVFIPTVQGMGVILRGLLDAIGNAITAVDPAQMYVLELSLSEILIAALSSPETTASAGAADRRKSTFHRITQTIESQLHDAGLSLSSLAENEGLSVRAIQKLFQEENLSFGQYLRRRRLERSAQDLVDPAQSTTLVADIGFRWGFSDPAHFSRAFREQYGTTPTVFRDQVSALPDNAAAASATRGRPHMRPGWSRHASRRPSGIDDEDSDLAGASVTADDPSGVSHHHLPANARTVHWGYFSRSLPPVLTVKPGDIVTIETITQHATDDVARMVHGDAGAESVMGWTRTRKNVDRRGAGPMDASVYGRGAGEGFGVHVCTGPIAIEGATPGDVLEIEILDIVPRPSQSPEFAGRSFGSNAAVWWGHHYKELLTEPRPREVVTLYEIIHQDGGLYAKATYNFRWTPQRDPFGVIHPTIDYPGVPVDHTTIIANHDVLAGVLIPVRPHFGIIALAADHPGLLDSTPPSSFGGNIDNWRLGAGARLYLPVSVAGGLLSVGDPHASQGDGEISGTAIECSLTGTFQLHLHERNRTRGMLRDLTYPLIETADAWIVQGFSHPNYLAELGETALSEVYKQSSLDGAMRDAFRKARRLLMVGWALSEDEAISLLSIGVDFGVTQVVDGNLGVHAIIPKDIFIA